MAKLLLRRYRRVLVDVNTQYDLIHFGNHNRTELLRKIRRLFAWARVRNIPVISTALCRRTSSCPELLDDIEALCQEGSSGQKKIRTTILNSNVVFGPENRMDLPHQLLSNYQQVILESRSEDPFSLPRADRLMSEARADEFVVFGVGLENSIKHIVLGLMRRRKKVAIVRDAIDRYGCNDFEMGLRKLEIKGARIINTADLAGESRLNGHKPRVVSQAATLMLNPYTG